jgi:tetratricopeptide (TPR) repeat protein
MPTADVALWSGSIVDISHESLMRCWTRLITWAAEEAEAAAFYLRLSQAATWFAEEKAGLWRPPELRLGERWRERTHPTAAWARRFDDHFDQAMAFLDRSLAEHQRLIAESERQRLATLRRVQWTAAVLATLLLVAVGLAVVARRENTRAGLNLALARAAVDESLSSVDLDPSRLGADVPALEELRRELLTKAQAFYAAIGDQEPSSEQARHDLALAHLRLGHISRLLQQPDEAARQYGEAITRFEGLVTESPGTVQYRASLADAYNWLGEVHRARPSEAAEAERAYDRALALQRALVDAEPGHIEHVRQLARSTYNRGIVLAGTDGGSARAESDFREAIRLLLPHAGTDAGAAQELARAFNNLAGVLTTQDLPTNEAREWYQKAIDLDERLVAAAPDNREYKLELAKYHDNLAAILHEHGDSAEADAQSRRAVELLDELSRLAPSLAVEHADARTLRGRILQERNPAAAEREYSEALSLFEQGLGDQRLRRLPDFHQRFGDLLLDLAAFSASAPEHARGQRLLDGGVQRYAAVVEALAGGGSTAEMQIALDTLSRLTPAMPPSGQARLAPLLDQLRMKLSASR